MSMIQLLETGLLFLLVFLAGYRPSRSGKPYNSLLLTAHKLLSLGMVVFLGITVRRINQASGISAAALGLGVLSGLFFLLLIVTGGLVSVERPMPWALSIVHKIAPYLAILSTAATFALL